MLDDLVSGRAWVGYQKQTTKNGQGSDMWIINMGCALGISDQQHIHINISYMLHLNWSLRQHIIKHLLHLFSQATCMTLSEPAPNRVGTVAAEVAAGMKGNGGSIFCTPTLVSTMWTNWLYEMMTGYPSVLLFPQRSHWLSWTHVLAEGWSQSG